VACKKKSSAEDDQNILLNGRKRISFTREIYGTADYDKK